MTSRRLLPTAVVSLLTTLFAAHATVATKPDVVVILADDQGWGDLSAIGNANPSTPNIDSLVRNGALFERFYVCPVCSPSRAEFLTGRYHARGGFWGVSTGGDRLNLDEKTIGDTFKWKTTIVPAGPAPVHPELAGRLSGDRMQLVKLETGRNNAVPSYCGC
jgi:hypothetical protein